MKTHDAHAYAVFAVFTGSDTVAGSAIMTGDYEDCERYCRNARMPLTLDLILWDNWDNVELERF